MLQKTEIAETTPLNAPYLVEIQETQTEILPSVQDKELAELTAVLEIGFSHRKRRAERAGKIFPSLYILFAVVLIPLVIGAGIALTRGMTSLIWILLLAGLGGYLTQWRLNTSVLQWIKKNRSEDTDAANRLATLEDVRAVPAIIDLIGWMDAKAIRQKLWKALGRLLPRLTEQEAEALGTKRHQLAALWIQNWESEARRQCLNSGNEPLLGLLHIMRLVGQGKFQISYPRMAMTINVMPSLERWIAGKGAGQDPKVQQAAEACRDAILEKMKMAKPGEQLLRASSPSSPEILLRPAQGNEAADPQELLRPIQSE